MLNSDDGDSDVFFDSVDCLPPPQESLLTPQQQQQEFGYEIWVNEPLSVKERKERFLRGMGLVDASSEVSSQEEILSCSTSSLSLELERIRDSSGAVSNDCILPAEQVPEKLAASGREGTSETCSEDKADANFQGRVCELSYSDQELRNREAEALEELQDTDMSKKKKKNWWKHFVNSMKRGGGKFRSKLNVGASKTRRINVRQNKKRWMEFSALYLGQEIRAHKGLIWTMKFSPNGQYLASGGEDGVIRVWRVMSLNASSICFTARDSAASKVKHDISSSQKKPSNQSFIVLPNKIFTIEESPLQEFYGHSSDVMDLAWSSSDVSLTCRNLLFLSTNYVISSIGSDCNFNEI